jgi:AraC-like DNA-binding protein
LATSINVDTQDVLMPAEQRFALHQADPDLAGSEDRPRRRITSLSLTHRPSKRYQLDVHGIVSGPVSIEETRCSDATQVRLPGGDPGYVIAFPVRGTMRTIYQGREIDVGAGRAAVFGPLAEVAMNTADDYDCVMVRVDADVLEDALSARLGFAVQRPLPLASTMELSTGPGRGWAGLVELILGASAPRSLLTEPAIAAAWREALFDTVLRALDHPHRETLDAAVHSWAPHMVRRWVDIIEAFPERALTPTALAADAGTSVRVLDQSWMRHLEVRPTQFLRRTRLEHAHRDLLDHSPTDASVDLISSRWGFASPTRFSAGYARRYGHPPEQTLRGPAYA